MRPLPPLPAARHILGSCVVFPEPVSPAMITTWCPAIVDVISSARTLIGSSGGNSIRNGNGFDERGTRPLCGGTREHQGKGIRRDVTQWVTCKSRRDRGKCHRLGDINAVLPGRRRGLASHVDPLHYQPLRMSKIPPLLPHETLIRVLRLATLDGLVVLMIATAFALASALGRDFSGAIIGLLIAGGGATELHGVTLMRRGH